MAGSLKPPLPPESKAVGYCCFIVVMPARRYDISRFSLLHSRGSAPSPAWCLPTATRLRPRGENLAGSLHWQEKQIRLTWIWDWTGLLVGTPPCPPLWARDSARRAAKSLIDLHRDQPGRLPLLAGDASRPTESVNRMQSFSLFCFIFVVVFALIL